MKNFVEMFESCGCIHLVVHWLFVVLLSNTVSLDPHNYRYYSRHYHYYLFIIMVVIIIFVVVDIIITSCNHH